MALFHSFFTIVLFAAFVGLILWAYNKKRAKEFSEAENLPFIDEPAKTEEDKP